jgi:hypothetical protein
MLVLGKMLAKADSRRNDCRSHNRSRLYIFDAHAMILQNDHIVHPQKENRKNNSISLAPSLNLCDYISFGAERIIICSTMEKTKSTWKIGSCADHTFMGQPYIPLSRKKTC